MAVGLVALAIGFAWWAVQDPDSGVEPELGGHVERADAAVLAGGAGRVDRETRARIRVLEEQVARLSAEVAELRAERGTPVERTPLGPASVDLDALARKLEAAKATRALDRLDALSDAQLLAESRRLAKEDPIAEREALEAALRRPLSAEHRGRALTYLGLHHRRAGDLAAAERALQEALAAGAGPDERAWTSYELAMTVSETGDHARALGIVEGVPGGPGVGDWNRRHALWAVGTLSERNGDLAAARAHFERLLADCAGDEEFAWLARKAEDALAELP